MSPSPPVRRVHRSVFLLILALLWWVQPCPADDTTSAPPLLNVFEGRVLDHEGKPVASAKVVVADSDEGFINYMGPERVFAFAPDEKVLLFFTKRNGKRSAEATTDAEGRFRIQGLKEGKYDVLAVHSERGITVVRGVEQSNAGKPLNVTLKPPTFVEGTIKGLEKNVSGWISSQSPMPWDQLERVEGELGELGASHIKFSRVSIRPNVEIADDGCFRTGPLPRGRDWFLTFERLIPKRGFSATLLRVPLALETGKTASVSIDLTEGQEISGRVSGPKGDPLPDVAVRVTNADGDRQVKLRLEANQWVAMAEGPFAFARQYGAVTDKDGKFIIRGVPDGEYELRAERYAVRTGFG